jgi:hypothetical protein
MSHANIIIHLFDPPPVIIESKFPLPPIIIEPKFLTMNITNIDIHGLITIMFNRHLDIYMFNITRSENANNIKRYLDEEEAGIERHFSFQQFDVLDLNSSMIDIHVRLRDESF